MRTVLGTIGLLAFFYFGYALLIVGGVGYGQVPPEYSPWVDEPLRFVFRLIDRL